MQNKLLLTTALVSSVVFSQAVLAETKITGNVETTYNSFSYDEADSKIDGKSGFGMETNIGVAHKRTLSNGMILSAGMVLETGNASNAGAASSDVGYVEVSSGNFSIHVGQDYGNNLNVIGIPTVGDGYHDVIGGLGTIASTNYALGEEAHDALHLGLAQKFEGGVAYLNYAPSEAKNDNSGDSAVQDDGGSILELGVKASFAGVRIHLAQETSKQDNDGGAVDDHVTRLYSLSYSLDKLSVGVSKRTEDTGAAADSDTDMMSYGVTYAVADNLSLGIQIGDIDQDGLDHDEKVKMISAGYNLGGMGIEFSYAQVENGKGSDEDGEVFQIRTVASF